METVGDIIFKILKKSGNENVFYTGLLQNKWETFVGKFFAQSSFPDRIYNKTLFIRCSNPAFKQEIFFFKDKIIERINIHFKKDIVSEIKVFLSNKANNE